MRWLLLGVVACSLPPSEPADDDVVDLASCDDLVVEIPAAPKTDVLWVVGTEGPVLDALATGADDWMRTLWAQSNDLRLGVLDADDGRLVATPGGGSFIDPWTSLTPGMLGAMVLDASASDGAPVFERVSYLLDHGTFHREDAELHIVFVGEVDAPEEGWLTELEAVPRQGRLSISQITPDVFESWPASMGTGLSLTPSTLPALLPLTTRPFSYDQIRQFEIPEGVDPRDVELWVEDGGFRYQGVLDGEFSLCSGACFVFTVDGSMILLTEFTPSASATVRICW